MAGKQIFEDYRDWLQNEPIPNGKKKVVEASLDLFSTQGFNGTSTKQIAQKSGMSEATIFKYFANKDELLKYILAPVIENIIPNYIEDFTTQLNSAEDSIEKRIHFIVRNRYDFLVSNKEAALILISELMTNEEIKNKIVTLFMSRANDLQTIFKKFFFSTNEVREDLQIFDIMRLVAGQIAFLFIQNYKLLQPENEQATDHDLSVIETNIYQAIKK
ncbi:TetR/AcrR family transcriptional regulator [Lactobacillus sp. YT155]|uniref:TetR/AcrR family transcriptional regulator n=1 Tax=Lactobacillus sp. YT155 TaxID=3060955 RepID=UPI00265F7D61|nr:TetR/AcrR family transcriptional regulator [Lactobacillus sp. YT155]MDO1605100.1 TetR/AcrR family transcriptional regulator [Lactobacillus sp. YT155]